MTVPAASKPDPVQVLLARIAYLERTIHSKESQLTEVRRQRDHWHARATDLEARRVTILQGPKQYKPNRTSFRAGSAPRVYAKHEGTAPKDGP